MVDTTAATGTCAVCIVGGERSLVANLAAANNFKVNTQHSSSCFEHATQQLVMLKQGCSVRDESARHPQQQPLCHASSTLH